MLVAFKADDFRSEILDFALKFLVSSELESLWFWVEVEFLIAICFILESNLQIVAGLRVVRLELQGLLKTGNGLVESPLSCHGHPEVVVCFHVGRFDL